ncbi:replication/maintenance protein RepL [Crocosphaera sp. Alani8]|uniref:replication/maintenance protein RepL n=1 Tax=Crocosphaera sp. Alani8 TaxID=3038952 RepID=UPI00313C301B
MDSKQYGSKRLRQAIEIIESNGLSVYRRRRKEKSFVKLYTDSLEAILPKISGSALKVLHALGFRMGFEDTIVEMTQREIQQATALSEHTIREALNELEELKIISRLGPNNRRKYVLSQMFVKKGK